MSYRYIPPYAWEDEERDYNDWSIPGIGFVNIDRFKWFRYFTMMPRQIYEECLRRGTNIREAPEFRLMNQYLIHLLLGHRLHNHQYMIPDLGYVYRDFEDPNSMLHYFWNVVFRNKTPLQMFYEAGGGDEGQDIIALRRKYFNKAMYAMHIILHWARWLHFPVSGVKLIRNDRIFNKAIELINWRFDNIHGEFREDEIERMRTLLGRAVHEYKQLRARDEANMSRMGEIPEAYYRVNLPRPIPPPSSLPPAEQIMIPYPPLPSAQEIRGPIPPVLPAADDIREFDRRIVEIQRNEPEDEEEDHAVLIEDEELEEEEEEEENYDDFDDNNDDNNNDDDDDFVRYSSLPAPPWEGEEEERSSDETDNDTPLASKRRKYSSSSSSSSDDTVSPARTAVSEAAAIINRESQPPPPPQPIRRRQVARKRQPIRKQQQQQQQQQREPPSYLIAPPGNSFSNFIATLGRTGSHPDGSSSSFYGTYRR